MTEVKVTEERLLDLVSKERKLEELLAAYPELQNGKKLTPAAKRYKQAFAKFLDRVEIVLSSEHMTGLFQVAAIHGFEYKGPTLAHDIREAKELVGK